MNAVAEYLKKKLDSQSKILLKNTSWILGSNLIRSGLVFLRSIVIARGLGVELYGVYVIVVSFVVSVQDLFNLNIGNAFIKYGAEFKTEKRTDKVVALMKACVYATMITGTLALAVTGTFIYLSYDSIVKTPGLQWFVFFYALADVASFFDPMGRSILRLYYKFKINSIVQTITAVIEFIVVCSAVLLNPKDLKIFFIAMIFVKLLNTIINNGAGLWELRHEIFPFIRTKISLIKDRKKEIAGFVFGNSLSKTLLTIMNQCDTLMVGTLTGTANAAYYNVAKRMAGSLQVISDPFTLSIYPQLSTLLAEKKYSEIKTMLFKITRTTAVPALIFILIAALFNEPIIQFLYGSDYLPAAQPFLFTLVGAMLTSVFFWNQSFMQSWGLIRFRFFVYLFAIAGGAMIAYFLVPQYLATGMAIAVLITKIVITLIFTKVAVTKLNLTN